MMRLGNTGNKSNYLSFGLLPSAFIPKHFTLLQVWNASSHCFQLFSFHIPLLRD